MTHAGRSWHDGTAIRLSAAVRRERTLYGKVVQAMLEHPKNIRPIATAFALTTQNIYSIGYAFIDDLIWVPGLKGGRRPLISPHEELEIRAEVSRMIARDRRPTFEEFAGLIRRVRARHHKERLQRAKLLAGARFKKYALSLPLEPSDSWIYSLIKNLELKLATACEITSDRLDAATRSNIRHWFDQIYTEDVAAFFRDATIFNADEANLDFDMSSKVIADKAERRVSDRNRENCNSHVTVMVTVGVRAKRPPLFILIGGKTAPDDLSDVIDRTDAILHWGGSGWMTREIFREYAGMFVTWVREQRKVGYFTEDEPVLLFLDSHGSRADIPSLMQFRDENVMVITFPGQITHVIQPFDIGIAAPMRVYYRRICRKLRLKAKEKVAQGKLTESVKRKILIQSVVESCIQATTQSNVKAAFEKAGLWPRNIEMTFTSPYVKDDDEDPMHPQGRYSKRSPLAGRVITDDELIEELMEREKESGISRLGRK